MGAVSKIASVFRMTDEVWKRHANPWSVWTRFGAIPLMILAIWSRVWLGRWCLVPIAAVIVWLWLNPRVFAPVENPTGWHLRRETVAKWTGRGSRPVTEPCCGS
jgi:hypothetical protein